MKLVLFLLVVLLLSVADGRRRRGSRARAEPVAAAPVFAAPVFRMSRARAPAAEPARRSRAVRSSAVGGAVGAAFAAFGRGRRRRGGRVVRAPEPARASRAVNNNNPCGCRRGRRGRKCRRRCRPAPAAVPQGPCAQQEQALAACNRRCRGRRRRKRRCRRAVAACQAAASAALAQCRGVPAPAPQPAPQGRCAQEQQAVGACNRRCRGRKRRKRRCRRAVAACQAAANAALARCMAPPATVALPTQPPHRCHRQMQAIQACNRRCRGKKRRRRRCHRAVRTCQTVARHALARCMAPVTIPGPIVVATSPPHRCHRQIRLLNRCSRRRCRGKKCRKDKKACRKRARKALRACMTPVVYTLPQTTTPRPTTRRRTTRRRTTRRWTAAPTTRFVPCRHQIRRLARCRDRNRRRGGRKCRNALRALQRCRGITSRPVRPVSIPKPRHVCDRFRIKLARCTSKRCRIKARCRYNQCHCHGGVRRLRTILRAALDSASSCNDNSECVRKRYGAVARIRRRISHAKGNCRRRAHKSCRRLVRRTTTRRRRTTRRPAVKKYNCRPAKRRIRRLASRRAALRVNLKGCSDDDALCAKRLLKKMLRINHRIRKISRKCGIKLAKMVPCKLVRPKHIIAKTCGKHVYSHDWRNAIGCHEIDRHFKAWIKYQNCRRKVVFNEHKRCNPLDTSCLRFAFTQLVHIAQRVARGRNEVVEQVRVCDECAPIKIQFRRWRSRQRARRNRLHKRLTHQCRDHQVACQQRIVQKIKAITDEINLRRSRIHSLHRDCKTRRGTHGGFMLTAFSPVTQPPAVERSSSAALISASVLAVVAAVLVFIL